MPRSSSAFIMYRTLRPLRLPTSPTSMKSRYAVWLTASTAPPTRGMCSWPSISMRRPCAQNSVRTRPVSRS
ncbi:Uncharacterised protein [Mycobacteroides abscessus subsp. abscessus]|nr:Uncharacterised protein [Mycobacteroides abscessus subsp. abscessus]